MKKKEKIQEMEQEVNTAKAKKKHQGHLVQAIISALITIALGVLLCLVPLRTLNLAVHVLGWVLAIGGGIGIIVSLVSWGVSGVGELMMALLALVGGILILIFPYWTVYFLCFFLCLNLLIEAVGSLIQGMALKKSGWSVIPNLLLMILLLVLGGFILFQPVISARWMLQVGGVLMIVGALLGVVIRAIGARKLHKAEKKAQAAVVDADE